MRIRRRTQDPTVADLDEAAAPAEVLDDDATGGGLVRGALRLVTLPFRLTAAVVRVVAMVARTVIGIIMIPITLSVFLVVKLVQWAADLTYALWRAVLKVVGAVLAVLRFVFRVVNATIGGLVRLVLKLVGTTLKALLWAFSLGRISGARRARKERAEEADGDAVVDVAA